MALVTPRVESRARLLAAALLAIAALALHGCAPQPAPPPAPAAAPAPPAGPPQVAAAAPQEAGRYLIVVGGCNDCHTPGFMDKGIEIPEEDWLAGVPLGWRGPWGTTYASNLRLSVQKFPEDAWVEMVKSRKARPPMPWPSVSSLAEKDARAMYAYLKSLGPAGSDTPAGVPPGQEPATPYLSMVPQPPAASR